MILCLKLFAALAILFYRFCFWLHYLESRQNVYLCQRGLLRLGLCPEDRLYCNGTFVTANNQTVRTRSTNLPLAFCSWEEIRYPGRSIHVIRSRLLALLAKRAMAMQGTWKIYHTIEAHIVMRNAGYQSDSRCRY